MSSYGNHSHKSRNTWSSLSHKQAKKPQYKHKTNLTNTKKAKVFDTTITPEDEEIMRQHEVERQKEEEELVNEETKRLRRIRDKVTGKEQNYLKAKKKYEEGLPPTDEFNKLQKTAKGTWIGSCNSY